MKILNSGERSNGQPWVRVEAEVDGKVRQGMVETQDGKALPADFDPEQFEIITYQVRPQPSTFFIVREKTV